MKKTRRRHNQPLSCGVLYLDYRGNESPIGRCYVSSLYRLVSSNAGDSVNKYSTPSTLMELESSYCPQCLTSFDYGMHRGVCNSCKICPKCFSTLSITVYSDNNTKGNANVTHTVMSEDQLTKLICSYKCGYCHYNSFETGVFSTLQVSSFLSSSLFVLDKDTLEMTRTSLEDSYAKVLAVKNAHIDKLFQLLVGAWTDAMEKYNHKISQDNSYTFDIYPLSSPYTSLLSQRNCDEIMQKSINYVPRTIINHNYEWCIENLEIMTLRKRHNLVYDASGIVIIRNLTWNKLTPTADCFINRDDEDRVIVNDADETNILQIFMQACLISVPISSYIREGMEGREFAGVMLLPISVPLRPRMVRRCHYELCMGKPGILVKSKMNPLEGDSSLRYGQGQWFMKDSSAIHMLPRIRIVNYRVISSENTCMDSPTIHHLKKHVLLFSVSNTTHRPMKLMITYIPCDIMSEEYSSTPVHQYGPKNILLDTFSTEFVSALPICSYGITSFAQYDDCIVGGNSQNLKLEPAEDAFLNLGNEHDNIPDVVENWDPLSVLEKNKKFSESKNGKMMITTLRLVASRTDTAWLEFVAQSNEKVSRGDIESKVTTFNNPFNCDHNYPDYVSLPLFLKTTFSDELSESLNIRSTVDYKDILLFILAWRSTL